MISQSDISDEDRNITIRGRFGQQYTFESAFHIPASVVPSISDIIRSFLGLESLLEARKFAEGSFAEIWKCGEIVGRFIRASAGDKFLEKVHNSTRTCVHRNLIALYCSGKVYRESDKHLLGIVQFMPLLFTLPNTYDDEEAVLARLSAISHFGFHNDFKVDNLMITSTGELQVLDFDFFEETKIVISVTSFQNITADLASVLSGIADEFARKLRAFYDYTYLSTSLHGNHPLYRKVLNRLKIFFKELSEAGVLDKVRDAVGPSIITDIPFEVLVRCPNVDAVSIHLFDLRGNAFAHRLPDWESFPSIIKSNGVYWPDR